MANISSPFSQGTGPAPSLTGVNAVLQSPVLGPDHDGDFPVSFGDNFMAQPAPITTPLKDPVMDHITSPSTGRPSPGFDTGVIESPFSDAFKK